MSGAISRRREQYLTGDIASPVDYLCRAVRIPNDENIIAAVNAALLSLTRAHNWREFGTVDVDATLPLMQVLFYEYLDSSVCMIGAIFPYVTAQPPAHALPCDGSQHQRLEYPRLYDALDSQYIVDADHFVTPDLRGRTVIGAGTGPSLTSRTPGEVGGTETHTLTVDEMPGHSHTSSPHSHTEIIAVATLINGGVEAPASAATPSAGTTGATAVTIDSTGGGEEHNNMPPFVALTYCMVAR